MKDFLDTLFEQIDPSRSQRQQTAYLSRLRALVQEAPPVRSVDPETQLLLGLSLDQEPTVEQFSALPQIAVFFYAIQDSGAAPQWFREAKTLDAQRSFFRFDPLADEAQVLETIAMGADGYSLEVAAHDPATLQYLCELGADYRVPALLRCRQEEELAQALFVEAETWIGLEGELAVPEILELPLFEQRRLIVSLSDLSAAWREQTLGPLKQLILHLDPREEN